MLRRLAFFVLLFAPTLLGAMSLDEGLAWLSRSPGLKGLSLAEHLRPLDRAVDGQGNVVLRYERHLRGLRLRGETRLLVRPSRPLDDALLPGCRALRAGELSEMSRLAATSPSPALSAEEARRIALRDLRSRGALGRHELGASARDDELVLARLSGGIRLVWAFRLPASLAGLATWMDVLVDAETGEIAERAPGAHAATGRGLRLDGGPMVDLPVVEEADGRFRLTDPSRKLNAHVYDGQMMPRFDVDEDAIWNHVGSLRKENQCAQVDAFLNMTAVIDFWKNELGFVWYRGLVPARVCSHYQDFGADTNNAMFNAFDSIIYLGDGTGDADGYDYFAKALDIIGHEWTHGVLYQRCPLEYRDDSGTINEHIADVGGHWVQPGDWRIGETIVIEHENATRDMSDPTRGQGHLLHPGMTYRQWWDLHEGREIAIYPDRMSLRIVCHGIWEDNGGVHLNSGILNRFYHRAVTGDGLAGPGLGEETMRRIYWRMIDGRLLSERCTFDEFRDVLLTTAALVLTDREREAGGIETLRRAFEAIEL